MQNNKSALQKDYLFDFDNYNQSEEEVYGEILYNQNNLNSNGDYLNQSYAEFNGQSRNVDDSKLTISEPDVSQDYYQELNGHKDTFLSAIVNYENDEAVSDLDNIESEEITYLDLIRKSEIAVAQQVHQQAPQEDEEHSQLEDYFDSKYQSPQENTKTYTVVCIDDSKAVVNAIKMYLDDNIFSVVGINDPLKALMKIVRLKPDLILLDINMPTLDGYELCSLLRKHSSLKETPVIMVTGRKGIVDRVKAKLVKSSDYLTKPFHKKDLLKIIFKYF